jgi:hypothetical protein
MGEHGEQGQPDEHDEYTGKVAAHVGAALEPGEQVVAAAPGAPRGSMRALAYGNGRLARDAVTAGRTELAGFGVPYARQFVVVLTDRRVCWFRTTFTGRPKALVAALARGEVDDLVLGEGRVLGQRFGELRMVLRDGRRCTLEVARPFVARADDLVTSFHRGAPDQVHR